MNSMYEKIMNLPLFKGIGKEQVSIFLEKTKIEFINYRENEQIIEEGQTEDNLLIVVKGEIKKTYQIKNSGLILSTIEKEGGMIGADNLFGIYRNIPCDAYAKSSVSIMSISKVQYINLLGMDCIYLFNYLNYLSSRSQHALCALLSIQNTIDGRIRLIDEILVSPMAISAELHGRETDLASYCGVTKEELEEWVSYSQLQTSINDQTGLISIHIK